MFQCFNVVSIGPAISFRSFDVSHRRRWGGDIIILTPISYSFIFSVLCFHWKLWLIPFRPKFQCLNVASIGPSISFWSFEVSCISQYECDIMSRSSIDDARPLWKVTFPQWTYVIDQCTSGNSPLSLPTKHAYRYSLHPIWKSLSLLI